MKGDTLKNYQKLLLLGAAVIMSSQPSLVGASEFFSSDTQDQFQVMREAGEEAPSDFQTQQNLPKVPVRLGTLPVKNSGSPFRDISQSIFKNNINWIYSRGVTTGYTPTTYNPKAKVTRGEMAVFLHRMAGSPGYTPPFNVYRDVTQYKNHILWLTATTVTNGTAPYYNPNGKVTRGQMAAFLHRMAKASGKAPASGTYNGKFWDTKTHMFKNDIGWLSSKGITTGYTATTFKPDDDISREEMAAFLYRFYSVTVNNQVLPPAPQPYAAQPTYYSQLDARWKNIRLNNFNVGISGCVPTSLSMVFRGSYGMNVDPGIVALKADTISRESFGLSGQDLINTSKAYGKGVEVISNINRAATLLRTGYPLIFYIDVGVGHAVVVSDYDPGNGQVSVNDPYGRVFYPSGKTTLSELWGRPSRDGMDWNAGRPVFAIKASTRSEVQEEADLSQTAQANATLRTESGQTTELGQARLSLYEAMIDSHTLSDDEVLKEWKQHQNVSEFREVIKETLKNKKQ